MIPTSVWIIVVITVIAALAFDVINGFHDAANSIATVVSTRVLSPRQAVLWAAFFNFIAILVFPTEVANTIKKIVHIDPTDAAFVYVVLAALIGAIVWDLITWFGGLPTSSSHALIGGLVGAGMMHGGREVISWDKVMAAVKFIPLAPLIGFVVAYFIMVGVFWLFRRWSPVQVDRLFRKIQLLSAALYSLGHGGNDAQKTMGIILALLVAAGMMEPDTKLSLFHMNTAWIIWGCGLAMAVGTAMGGWRIVKTMGMRLTKLRPVGGSCAETAGALTLFLATHWGIPVSTTHTITGAIIGVGATNKLSGIKWGVAQRIVWAWIITIPASAGVAALCFYAVKLFHPEF
jgi:PiT family inorganic phosphate transporter